MSDASNSYDEVPYLSGPIRLSHPMYVSAVAHLFGMQTTPPSQARVLEIGCASGGNIIPMACEYPQAQFVGIDASQNQVDEANATIGRLGLNNITVLCEDISHYQATESAFDFVICHGVFSWVSPEVQQAILRIGKRSLSERGVFYISYNTFPGWHMRSIVRDMMQYHIANFSEPREQINQSRELLSFLVESCAADSDAYRLLLRDEAEVLSRQHDSYLFHEHLERYNEPLYFSDFMRKAHEVDLQYLGEAEFALMLLDNFPSATAEILKQASLLQQEQYMDFLRGRKFRCSLLCHDQVQLDRNVNEKRLSDLSVSLVEPLPETPVELDTDEPVEWKLERGVVGVSSRPTKHAMTILGERFPLAIRVSDLCAQVAVRTGDPEQFDPHSLQVDLLALVGSNLLRVCVEPPEFVLESGLHPTTTPLARIQSTEMPAVSNQLHTSAKLDDVTSWLLPHLDGQSTREQLESALVQAVDEGLLHVTNDRGETASLTPSTAKRIIEVALRSLAKQALLIA